MRIRKNNAKISQQLLLYSAAAKPHIVCQLNQSPWDVIVNFSPPSSPPPPPPPLSQVVVVNKIGASGINGTSMDSIPVLKRDEFDDSRRKLEYEDGGNTAVEQSSTIWCCKTDGRSSWQCRKEAAAGSYSTTSHQPIASKKHNINAAVVVETSTPTPPRTHPRPKKASSSSSNPYEFYYYSGFGPQWGKKRGSVSHDNIGTEMVKNVQEMDQRSTLPQNIIGDDFDCVDQYEDEEDEEEEEINGKKRARKPIKARSLKSLM